MKRNTKLLGIKQFKHEDHFNTHVNALLKHLYPNAAINDNKIAFKEAPYMGISIVFYPSAIYAQLSEPFEKLVNTKLQWTGSSGKCYMYPWDRNMFDDSILGMEQKAVFFVMVMEVALKFFIDNE